MERIQRYISHLQDVLAQLTLADVQHSIDVIMEAYYAEKQIFVIGNGGSASTASHIACDLGKGTSVPGKPPISCYQFNRQRCNNDGMVKRCILRRCLR